MKNFEKYLDNLPRYHAHPGIFRIKKFVEENQAECKSYTVIIGGTNGKGSVSAMLEQVLKESGISTGCYRSPHVYDFRERFTWNGELIEQEAIIEILEFVKKYFEKNQEDPTFADVLTACATLYFSRYKEVEVLLLEVGMGGLLDPVNVARRDISIITSVGHDHSHIIGKYPDQIAREKAGIVHPGIPLITAERNPEVLDIFRQVCRKNNAPMIIARPHRLSSISFDKTTTLYKGKKYHVGIPGYCQVENTPVALKTIAILGNTFSIPENSILLGMKKVKLPWRMEIFRENPTIIFDGAHNRESWQNLVNTLKFFRCRDIHIVLSIQKIKDAGDFPSEIPGKRVTLHLPNLTGRTFYKAKKLADILKFFKGKIKTYTDMESAIIEVTKNPSRDNITVFTGSFKIAGQVRDLISCQFQKSAACR